MDGNKWFIPSLKNDLFSFFGLNNQANFRQVRLCYKAYALKYHTDKEILDESVGAIRQKRDFLKVLTCLIPTMTNDHTYRNLYYTQGFGKAEIWRKEEDKREKEQLEQEAQNNDQRTKTPPPSNEPENFDDDEDFQKPKRNKFSYERSDAKTDSKNASGQHANRNDSGSPKFAEDPSGSDNSNGESNTYSHAGGNGSGFEQNGFHFNPLSFGHRPSNPDFTPGYNPYHKRPSQSSSSILHEEFKKIEAIKEMLGRKEEQLKHEEMSQQQMRSRFRSEQTQLRQDVAKFRQDCAMHAEDIDRRYIELEKKKTEVEDRINALKEQQQCFEAESLKKKEEVLKREVKFEAESEKMRYERQQFDDEVRKWTLSKEETEREQKLADAKLNDRELAVSQREADLAYNEATRRDKDLLISQRATAQPELNDLKSQIQAAKRELEDSVRQPSKMPGSVSSSSQTGSSNEATSSRKAAKTPINSRWDKSKGVRVCLLCPENNAFEHKHTRKVREHLVEIHDVGITYKCPECARVLCRAEILKQHLAKIHGK